MLLKLNTAVPKTIAAIQKKVLSWVDCPINDRAFAFMKVSELRKVAKDNGIRIPPGIHRNHLLELVSSKCNSDTNNINTAVNNNPAAPPLDPVIVSLLKSTFMKPQKKGNSEGQLQYARLGHELEDVFINEFYNHDGGQQGVAIKAIFGTGIVMHQEKPYLKDSPDALLITDDDEKIPIEVKGRVSVNTFRSERSNFEEHFSQQQRSQYESTIIDETKYIRVDAMDDDLLKYIPRNHEDLQLLHHVYTHDARTGVLLVGNTKTLMHGIYVDYPGELLNAYGDIIDYLYNRHLSWAYGPLKDVPTNTIMAVLESTEMSSYKVDEEAFRNHFKLWRSINGPNVNVKFPLPPCDRLIPYQHSLWNASKGGGDTITKLIDSNEENLGIRTPQTIATSRILMLYGVAYHRELQMLTAKDDVDCYDNLYDFRNACNTRSSFHQSLRYLRDLFLIEAEKAARESELISYNEVRQRARATLLPPATPNRSHIITRRAPVSRTVPIAPTPSYGGTPKRGRSSQLESNLCRIHSLRASECLGLYSGVKKKSTDKHVRKKDLLQGSCALCKMATFNYCFGCRRYLCYDRDRSDKTHKAPSFKMKTLQMDGHGKPKLTITGDPIYLTEYGVRSCHQITHEMAWDNHILSSGTPNDNFRERIFQRSEEQDEEEDTLMTPVQM